MTRTPGPAGSRLRGLTAALIAVAAVPLSSSAAGLSVTSEHLTTTATCALVSYPTGSAYSTDSFVASNNTSQNNGAVKNLTVQSQSGNNQRIYVGFNLSTCLFAPPAGALVRSATLRMFENGALAPACRTYDVFRNTVAWGEPTITWANQPAGTTSNVPPSATRTAWQDVGSPTTCANHASNTYVSWEVTTDVAAFLAGTATNDGWMIRDDVEDANPAAHIKFFAREQNALVDAPQLLITYTEV